MGAPRLDLLLLSASLALAACAEGKTHSDGGQGDNSDAAGPTYDAWPGRADAIPGSEICDGMDNDDDTFIDEGDLCNGAEQVSEARCNGLLGCVIDACNDGFHDVDTVFDTGCECEEDALEQATDDCPNARDLGDVPDSNQVVEVIGNLVPETDEDWYRFRAVDTPDATCDNFHVRVQFLDNPSDAYVIDVWRGGCGAEQICDGGTDVAWFTNFFDGSVGECPCGPTAANHCDDDTAEYHVRVRRTAAAALTCATYTLEISNGKYPAP